MSIVDSGNHGLYVLEEMGCPLNMYLDTFVIVIEGSKSFYK